MPWIFLFSRGGCEEKKFRNARKGKKSDERFTEPDNDAFQVPFNVECYSWDDQTRREKRDEEKKITCIRAECAACGCTDGKCTGSTGGQSE